MNENKVRTLPPLVHGKLSGILDFVFDKIELPGQAINKLSACNLGVHVLWWGETKPLFIRPKIIQILTEDEKKQIFINEHGGSSAKYEIKTKLNLFRSYLAKCDLMELAVFDTMNDEVIGSAFLKDLINLIFNSQPFSNSIINHMGNVVGEITYHFTFCEIISKKSSTELIQQNFRSDLDKFFSNNIITNKLTLNLSDLDSHRDDIIIESNSNAKHFASNTVLAKTDEIHYLQNENEFQRNTNLHYNSPVIQNFELQLTESEPVKVKEHFQSKNLLEPDNSVNSDKKQKNHLSLGISASTDNDKQTNLMGDDFNNINIKKVLIGTSKTTSSVTKKKTKVVESNKVTKLNYSSKELKQKESLAKAKDMNSKDSKSPVKLPIKKITYEKNRNSKEKKISENKAGINLTFGLEKKSKISNVSNAGNHMNMKNKPKPVRNTNCNLKPVKKLTEKLKTIENVSNEISKINKICFNSSRSYKDKHSDLEKLSVSHDNLGHQKNKILSHSNDEVNNKVDIDINVVKIAPSTEYIKQNENKLYENEESQFYEKAAPDYERPSSAKLGACNRINVNQNLCFNLNDPIERLYYETFFLNTKFENSEFEIAEMLNRTGDKYMLMQTTCNKSLHNDSAREEQIAADQVNSEFKKKKSYVHTKKPRKSFQEVNSKILESCSDSFEEESDNLSRISEEKLSSALKNELNEKKSNCNGRNEVLNFSGQQIENLEKTEVFPYCFDCHRFVYSKKLKELDKIIGALKNFETDLKKDATIPIQSFESNSMKEIVNESSHCEYFENGKKNVQIEK